MSALNLDIALGNIQYRLRKYSAEIKQSGPDAKLLLEMSALYRQYGCGALLLEMDADAFFHALYKSAKLYWYLLEQHDSHPKLDKYYLCKSRGVPLFDAMACGELTLARQIGKKSTSTWNEGLEYEDDFHYFDVLGVLLNEPIEYYLLEKKLKVFEASLEGVDSPRFQMCIALGSGDAIAFNKALQGMTTAWSEAIKKRRESESIDPYFDKTEAHIFVEGIALVKLAKYLGMRMTNEYWYVPSIALESSSIPFPKDFSGV